ncbi:1-phosphofructokinase family hexose kinase [soil metagenome]
MQRTLLFESLDVGDVNRARKLYVTASGKVVNAARTVSTLGSESLLVTFLGGDAGRFVSRTLDAEGVSHEAAWVEDDAPTRTCVTILEKDGPVTELVEEAPPVSGNDVAALESIVKKHLNEARALCLIGSFPPGVPEDFYARLAARAAEADIPVLVDAQKSLLLNTIAERPFLVKPNLDETQAALDLPTGDDERASLGAVSALVEKGARWALVTHGAEPALLGDESGGRWRIEAPSIQAVNPIGSGDTLAGGLLHAFADGASVPEAAAFGTACAAANALTPTSGVFDSNEAKRLLSDVRVVRLDGSKAPSRPEL